MALGFVDSYASEALGRTVLQYKIDAPPGVPVHGIVQGVAQSRQDIDVLRRLFSDENYIFSFAGVASEVVVPAVNERGSVRGQLYKFSIASPNQQPIDVDSIESSFNVSVHRISNTDTQAKRRLQDAITRLILNGLQSIYAQN